MKKILIIGGGEMQIPIIQKAMSLGHFCIVTDFDANAPGFKFGHVAAVVSTTDFEGSLKLALEHQIDGVITTSDYPVRTVAYICEKMGLPGLSLHAATICTDKFEQRKLMSTLPGYNPESYLVRNEEELNVLLPSLSYPMIVKPVDSSASRGVKLAEQEDELKEAFLYAQQFSNKKEVIIEEFIQGNEYSVESLSQDGKTHIIAVTQKTTGDGNQKYFVESQHVVPALLSEEEYTKIASYVTAVIKEISLDNSPAHTEVKLGPKGPVLIEIGARLGGDYITSHLIPFATGIDMLENAIRICLGEAVNVRPAKSCYAGIRFINSSNHSVAQELISKKDSVLKEYQIKPYKDVLLTNSLDRLGYLIMCADDRDELLAALSF